MVKEFKLKNDFGVFTVGLHWYDGWRATISVDSSDIVGQIMNTEKDAIASAIMYLQAIADNLDAEDFIK